MFGGSRSGGAAAELAEVVYIAPSSQVADDGTIGVVVEVRVLHLTHISLETPCAVQMLGGLLSLALDKHH